LERASTKEIGAKVAPSFGFDGSALEMEESGFGPGPCWVTTDCLLSIEHLASEMFRFAASVCGKLFKRESLV